MKNKSANEIELLEHRLNLTVRFTDSELAALEKVMKRYGFFSKGQAVRYMMFNAQNGRRQAVGNELISDRIEKLESTKNHADKLLRLVEEKLNSETDNSRQNVLVYARLADSFREIAAAIKELTPSENNPDLPSVPEVTIKKRDYQKVDIHGVLINNASSPSGANGKKVSAFRVSCTRGSGTDKVSTVYDVYKTADPDDAFLTKGTTVQVTGDLDIRRGRIIIIATKTTIVKKIM